VQWCGARAAPPSRAALLEHAARPLDLALLRNARAQGLKIEVRAACSNDRARGRGRNTKP
jgi:hypothetical protein